MDSRKLLTWHKHAAQCQQSFSVWLFSSLAHSEHLAKPRCAMEKYFSKHQHWKLLGIVGPRGRLRNKTSGICQFRCPMMPWPLTKTTMLKSESSRPKYYTRSSSVTLQLSLGAALWQSRQSTPQSLDCDPLVVARVSFMILNFCSAFTDALELSHTLVWKDLYDTPWASNSLLQSNWSCARWCQVSSYLITTSLLASLG